MLRIAQLTLDVRDINRMAAFWSAALGYRVEQGDDGNAKLLPPDDAPLGTQHMWLQASAGAKVGKNRAHPDLTASDPVAEVERCWRWARAGRMWGRRETSRVARSGGLSLALSVSARRWHQSPA